MTGAGYSGRALAAKLGIRPGERVVALGAPAHYAELLAPLPDGATLRSRLGRTERFIHRFATSQAELVRAFPRLVGALADDGMLWISWPKRASGVPTDLTEDRIRDIALPYGVVDVKVCAVDDVWSALKLVRRRELRR
ncbi:MAG TPA: DUF3052 domain-containing protein [Gemmatimonadales bacterium]|nr:DUF3052 domain-containing protein [Gemmatimonadales bacterium]